MIDSVQSCGTVVAVAVALNELHPGASVTNRLNASCFSVMVLITGLFNAAALAHGHLPEHPLARAATPLTNEDADVRKNKCASVHTDRVTGTLAETLAHHLSNKLVWPRNPIFLDKGAERQRGSLF